MGLYSKSPFAVKKINEWSTREPEFEKRAAFATMASYCMADKKAGNEVYEAFFPLIKEQATDERLYVKKAVNWGLRSIGKRNIDLNKQALFIAKEINQMESKAAQWIAKDAIRELEGEKVNILDYPRAIYRPIKVK
jgi:3-methyladenine DNA glycosylase AlkD